MERKLALIDSGGDPKLPVFLYDLDLADGSTTHGLFRGPLLLTVNIPPLESRISLTTFVQVYLHIFISPASAVGAKASSKRGNAKIHSMTEVIPSTICYAAIQVRYNLLDVAYTFQNILHLRRHTSHYPPSINGEKSGKTSTLDSSTSSSVNNWHNSMTCGSQRP